MCKNSGNPYQILVKITEQKLGTGSGRKGDHGLSVIILTRSLVSGRNMGPYFYLVSFRLGCAKIPEIPIIF
jgi:hypothetical protein